jgi:hypothetical protein
MQQVARWLRPEALGGFRIDGRVYFEHWDGSKNRIRVGEFR